MDDEKETPKGYDDDGEFGSTSDDSFSFDDDEDEPQAAADADESDDDEHTTSEDDEEYQFLDEDEMSDLELEEGQEQASGGVLDIIRAKLEPLMGEENFDRLKGMAIPIVVVVVFVAFAATKLSSLFSTPTPTRVAGPASVQTQITEVKTPKQPIITTKIVRPGDENKAEEKTAEETSSTEQPSTMAGTPAEGLPGQSPQAMQPILPGQPAQSQMGMMPQAQQQVEQPSSSIASGLRALLGGDDNPPQFQLQPGQPGYTAAVPTGGEAMMQMLQKEHEEQVEKFGKQLSDIDEHAKGMDDRLLRLEKMQESLDKKMSNINEQLDKVGKTLASLSKTLKDKPKRSEFTYHGAGPQDQHASSNMAPPRGNDSNIPRYRPQSGPMPAPGGERSQVGVSFETPYYHVEAVVPGRAWLKDQNGTTITVGKGDQIRGYGYVTYIDSENGLVVTSSGIVVRYGIDTR